MQAVAIEEQKFNRNNDPVLRLTSLFNELKNAIERADESGRALTLASQLTDKLIRQLDLFAFKTITASISKSVCDAMETQGLRTSAPATAPLNGIYVPCQKLYSVLNEAYPLDDDNNQNILRNQAAINTIKNLNEQIGARFFHQPFEPNRTDVLKGKKIDRATLYYITYPDSPLPKKNKDKNKVNAVEIKIDTVKKHTKPVNLTTSLDPYSLDSLPELKEVADGELKVVSDSLADAKNIDQKDYSKLHYAFELVTQYNTIASSLVILRNKEKRAQHEQALKNLNAAYFFFLDAYMALRYGASSEIIKTESFTITQKPRNYLSIILKLILYLSCGAFTSVLVYYTRGGVTRLMLQAYGQSLLPEKNLITLSIIDGLICTLEPWLLFNSYKLYMPTLIAVTNFILFLIAGVFAKVEPFECTLLSSALPTALIFLIHCCLPGPVQTVSKSHYKNNTADIQEPLLLDSFTEQKIEQKTEQKPDPLDEKIWVISRPDSNYHSVKIEDLKRYTADQMAKIFFDEFFQVEEKNSKKQSLEEKSLEEKSPFVEFFKENKLLDKILTYRKNSIMNKTDHPDTRTDSIHPRYLAYWFNKEHDDTYKTKILGDAEKLKDLACYATYVYNNPDKCSEKDKNIAEDLMQNESFIEKAQAAGYALISFKPTKPSS